MQLTDWNNGVIPWLFRPSKRSAINIINQIVIQNMLIDDYMYFSSNFISPVLTSILFHWINNLAVNYSTLLQVIKEHDCTYIRHLSQQPTNAMFWTKSEYSVQWKHLTVFVRKLHQFNGRGITWTSPYLYL